MIFALIRVHPWFQSPLLPSAHSAASAVKKYSPVISLWFIPEWVLIPKSGFKVQTVNMLQPRFHTGPVV